MKSGLSNLILATFILMTGFAASAESTLSESVKTKLQSEVEFIGSLYGTFYAPKAWKESHLGWNLPVQVALAKTKVAAATNLHDARQAVADLIKSTQDYHVSYAFYSTETATLPLQVKTVEGKTLIVFVDRAKLSETAFPFKVGDEILTMNGVPVAQELNDILKVVGNNVEATDRAIADMSLTRRGARSNYVVPQGPVTLSVKRADDTVGTVQLTWEYTPEQLSNFSGNRFLDKPVTPKFKLPMMVGSQALEFVDVENNYAIGNRNAFLPALGEKIWETEKDNSFQAYIYKNEEGNLVGVIRLFSYSTEDNVKAYNDFAAIIGRMQKFTSALVIDQNNNPGGSVFYLYALASTLSDQTLVVPKHRMTLMPSEAKECVDLVPQMGKVTNDEDAVKLFGPSLDGYPTTYQLVMGIRDYCRFIASEYKTGKNLSEPYYLWGVDKINPSRVANYTKPIVVLTNALDFSGGDFFPAILQDNKRVTIVGTRTAGAGGYVVEYSFPNSFGLEKIRMTGSLAERVDLNPIENLGVTPDVILPMTVDDVRNSYKSYVKGVKDVVKSLIK